MEHVNEIYPKYPSHCSCLNVRRASKAITQYYDRILSPSGLTTAQLSLLRNIKKAQMPTIGELAVIMRIDRTTINRNMKPMLAAEFISTKQGKDSRMKIVTLTKSDNEVLAEGCKLWQEAQKSIREYLGEEDLAKLVELLSKLEVLVP